MLFSREEVAAFVNRNFEPAWEMVREVPIINIDFGNGRVVTRTLHGNIASYVCCSDGQVVDILPGIYTPAVYIGALETPRVLATDLNRAAGERRARLREYHRSGAQRLRLAAAARIRPNAPPPRQPAPIPEGPRPKSMVEIRTERIVLQPLNQEMLLAARPRAGTDLATWNLLVQDTARIEAEHRLLIHDRLAQITAVWPEQIKKWLYKEVLHADLTDPYLGLGDALIGDDIFRQWGA